MKTILYFGTGLMAGYLLFNYIILPNVAGNKSTTPLQPTLSTGGPTLPQTGTVLSN